MQRTAVFTTFLIAGALLSGCDNSHESDSGECCRVGIHVTVPDGVGTVYLAGNLPELGPWQPDGVAMDGNGPSRTTVLRVPQGTALEYKFTLGSWAREGLGPSGTVMANFRLEVDADAEVKHEIVDFKKDPLAYIEDWQNAGIVGELVYWRDVASEFLEQPRHVEIWLPPGYGDSDDHYPVLYMHDGQNLFDPRIANTGVDWGVDEAIVSLVEAGEMEAVIVVGAWSSDRRAAEYSPWHEADRYARFLIDELMPRVNSEFRTLTGPQHTVAMGSSMGGLLSFYLVSTHPDVFGACGCVSTHFPLNERLAATFIPDAAALESLDDTPYILRDIAAGATVPAGTRYWFDFGTVGLDAEYGPTHNAVRDWLLAQQLNEGSDFVIRRYDGADHNEAAWRQRLRDPLRFLYAD